MAARKNRLLILGLLVAGIYAGELAYIFSLTPDPCEDAYITFRFSRNLADGYGPVFNPGERVEGYSNPLWMFSLAAAHRLGFDMVSVSRMAGALCNSLTLLLVWFIPWRWFAVRGILSLAGPLLYLLYLPLQFYAASGLETSCYTMLVTAAAAAGMRAHKSPGRCFGVFFILLLAALTRPEGILFFFAYCAWMLWRRFSNNESLRPMLPGILLFCLCYGAFLVWRLNYYGLLLPNTYYAKGSMPLYVELLMGFFINRAFFTNYAWLLFLLPFFIFVRLPDKRCMLPPLYVFIATGFVPGLCFSAWEWMPYFRYNLPVVPLMIICCQLLFAELWRSWAPTAARKLLWAALAAGLLFVAGDQFCRDLAFNYRWRELGACARFNWGTFGEWVRRELGTKPLIAIGDVGYFAYISRAATLDLVGLTSRDFADLKARYGSPDISFFPPSASFASFKKRELELLLSLAPDYVFLYTVRMKSSDIYPGSAAGIVEEPLFKEHYDYMTSFDISPGFMSEAWPRSLHPIDILDLSTGAFSWMRTGFGYAVYVKKNSPYPRFNVDVGTNARIKNIRTDTAPAAQRPGHGTTD